jgi:hypothetical protein
MGKVYKPVWISIGYRNIGTLARDFGKNTKNNAYAPLMSGATKPIIVKPGGNFENPDSP